jgi:DNA-directed RNA polymerase specialized sigma24 family protein
VRNADEFDEFYRGTYDRILAYLYAAGGDLAEAQDAAQEAYLPAGEDGYAAQRSRGTTDARKALRSRGLSSKRQS